MILLGRAGPAEANLKQSTVIFSVIVWTGSAVSLSAWTCECDKCCKNSLVTSRPENCCINTFTVCGWTLRLTAVEKPGCEDMTWWWKLGGKLISSSRRLEHGVVHLVWSYFYSLKVWIKFDHITEECCMSQLSTEPYTKVHWTSKKTPRSVLHVFTADEASQKRRAESRSRSLTSGFLTTGNPDGSSASWQEEAGVLRRWWTRDQGHQPERPVLSGKYNWRCQDRTESSQIILMFKVM